MDEVGIIQNSIDLERSIFKKVITIALFSCSLFLLLDLFYFQYYPLVRVEAIGIMVFSLFFILSQNPRYISKLIFPFVVVLFSIINVGWYVGGGFGPGITLLFILIIYLTLILISKKQRVFALVIIVLNLISMMIIEFNNPSIRTIMDRTEKELLNSYILISVSFSICAFLLYYVKNKYEETREQTFKANRKLTIQSRELSELNTQLKLMNENLELKVADKIKELEIENRKLLSFASMNIEKVDQPVHSLVTLCSSDGIHEVTDVLKKIQLKAIELDLEVRELNLELERSKR